MKYNNIYDNMKVAGPAFLTNNYIENKDTLLIENKVVTNKNKNFYNNIYGIHLCDNNWVK
jgi:CTP:phosphocholine cytidylyltransferase-like protein